jgi:hypothetical protein
MLCRLLNFEPQKFLEKNSTTNVLVDSLLAIQSSAQVHHPPSLHCWLLEGGHAGLLQRVSHANVPPVVEVPPIVPDLGRSGSERPLLFDNFSGSLWKYIHQLNVFGDNIGPAVLLQTRSVFECSSCLFLVVVFDAPIRGGIVQGAIVLVNLDYASSHCAQ